MNCCQDQEFFSGRDHECRESGHTAPEDEMETLSGPPFSLISFSMLNVLHGIVGGLARPLSEGGALCLTCARDFLFTFVG